MSVKSNLLETFSGFMGAIRRARLSAVEIVFLSAAVLFAGFVLIFYLNKVQPISSALAEREQLIKDLETKVNQLKTDQKNLADQTSNAEKILESLRSFEALLKPDERGTTQIINEVEALAKTHLLLSGDSTFRPEEADEPLIDENGNPTPQAASRDRKPKIYPILGIETVMIGDYSNLRRFLTDLERSKQFLIINALTFQGGDDKVARQLAKGGKQIQVSQDSIPVSLGIELDTYFQPPSRAAAATTPAVAKNTR